MDFPGIEIADVGLITNQQRNVLNTFWTKSDVDLSRGLDFTPRGPVLARFTHLNHADFSYKIVVNNRNNTPQRGTVRIFIAPKEDERGLPYTFRQQKNLMIEMDKFPVTSKYILGKKMSQTRDIAAILYFVNSYVGILMYIALTLQLNLVRIRLNVDHQNPL